jgi:hypothetical protein
MFDYRGQISINQVLSDIRSEPDKPFWLAYVRSTGKKQGSIKVVARAIYGAPIRKERRHRNPSERSVPLHFEKGTIPMTNQDNGDYETPLISHIISYNLYKVIH